MSLGMDAFRFSRCAEEARQVGVAVLFGFLGKSAVLLVCLTLPCKSLLQIIHCGCHVILLFECNCLPKWANFVSNIRHDYITLKEYFLPPVTARVWA